ncbi:helix-turn-helix domain-containing protein [Nocardia takedensis]|uniref:helix-turn-helix domain-containing protein n=1 Tax=Nocardia takedensis TaxID=259390 RepID=UPI00031A23B6
MVVVFDSGAHPVRDRVPAARAVLQQESAPCRMRFARAGMSAVMEARCFGELSLFRAEMTGHRLRRSARDVAAGPTGLVGFAVQEYGRGRFEQDGVRRLVDPGELMVVDLDAPYDFGWTGRGGSRCVHVPLDALGLTHEAVGAALAGLTRSPLYDLARHHLWRMWELPESVSDPAGDALAESTAPLLRALLVSVSGGGDRRDADLLMPRVRAFASARLGDPALSVAGIARHLDLPVPVLLGLAAQTGFDIARWIRAQRLRAARADLARGTAVERAARRWGFADAEDFRVAFAATFGLTPEAWRRTCREDGRSTAGGDPRW